MLFPFPHKTAIGVMLGASLLAGCDLPKSASVEELQERNKTLSRELRKMAERLEDSRASKDIYDKVATRIAEQEQLIKAVQAEIRDVKEANASLQEAMSSLQGPVIEKIEAAGATVKRDAATGNVTAIDFRKATVDQDLLASLSLLPSVTRLEFEGPQVTNESMTHVAQLRDLEYLDLSKTSVGDEGLAALTGLNKLRFLQLFRCDVTDEGFRSIAQLPSIQQVRCGQTRITDIGLEYLRGCNTIEGLDLSDLPQVTNAGLEIIATFPKLRFVKVWGKQITDEGVLKLAVLDNLEVVGLNDTSVSNAGMAAFQGKTKLREIHLFRCTSVGDEGLAYLSDCDQMRYLNLRDTGMSGEALASFQNMKQLKILDLSENVSPGIDDASLAYLSELPALEDLNLWRTKVSDAGMQHLGSLTTLTTLNLDKTQIGDGALQIASQLPNLEWLHIGSNPAVTDEGFKLLANVKTLKHLEITQNVGISLDAVFDLEDALPGCEIIGP